MLFDTSVWIDFSKGKKTTAADLLEKEIYSGRKVFVCPPVYQEVLQGIRSDLEYEELKQLMLSLDFLNVDSYYVAEAAANLYRSLRKKGITIRNSNDCIIACYAIHFNIKIVHTDRDFTKIAEGSQLKVYST